MFLSHQAQKPNGPTSRPPIIMSLLFSLKLLLLPGYLRWSYIVELWYFWWTVDSRWWQPSCVCSERLHYLNLANGLWFGQKPCISVKGKKMYFWVKKNKTLVNQNKYAVHVESSAVSLEKAQFKSSLHHHQCKQNQTVSAERFPVFWAAAAACLLCLNKDTRVASPITVRTLHTWGPSLKGFCSVKCLSSTISCAGK